MAEKVEKLLEQISELSLLEASELVKAMEDKFGISTAAPVAAAAAPSGDGAAAQEEEKTEFNVELSSVGDQKIKVIKALRSKRDLGLKEAKELVESAPAAVAEGVSKEEADELKKELEEVGATVKVS